MKYLLSVHDVWSGNFALVEEYLRRLGDLTGRNVALLVVPSYHGQTRLHEEEAFLIWLRAKMEAGMEVFLHGYRHLAAERVPVEENSCIPKRNLGGRLVNRYLTNHEAEFCGLDAKAKADLVSKGCDAFVRAGLPLYGFVAPTWTGTPSRRRLQSFGFRYMETRFWVGDMQSGRFDFVPPICWSQSKISRTYTYTTVLFSEFVFRFLSFLPCLRIAIHPGDFEMAGVFASVKRILNQGECISYARYFSDANR